MSKREADDESDSTSITVSTAAPLNASGQRRRNRKKALAISGAIGALVLIVIASVMYFLSANTDDKKAVKASDSFVATMRKDDVKASHDLLSAESKKMVSVEELKLFNRGEGYVPGDAKKVSDTTLASEKGLATKRQVAYEAKDKDGNLVHITITLVKEGGNWKVLNFDQY